VSKWLNRFNVVQTDTIANRWG